LASGGGEIVILSAHGFATRRHCDAEGPGWHCTRAKMADVRRRSPPNQVANKRKIKAPAHVLLNQMDLKLEIWAAALR
jgi:hypothetical protein